MGFGSSAVCDIRLNTTLSKQQREKYQNSIVVRDLLASAKTIAIIGLSSEKTKASNMVASYLIDEGYTIIPVNPRSSEILGMKCYHDLKSIPVPIDIVQVFRPSSEVAGIVDEAIEVGAKAVWMQLRIIDLRSADRAIDAGMHVVVDRCIKMEHGRYSGALHFAGMNTEVISSQRRKTR